MSEVDTASIRAHVHSLPSGGPCVEGEYTLTLCDALDAARAEIRELQTEVESLSHYHRSDLRGLLDALDARDAAIARVRALCDAEEDPHMPVRVLPLGTVSIRKVRAALDGPGGPDTWEWLGPDR